MGSRTRNGFGQRLVIERFMIERLMIKIKKLG
jgi:hypothetical protein